MTAVPTTTVAAPESKTGATWPIVATREIIVKLTDRNFLVSTLVTLLIIVGALVFQGFMTGQASNTQVVVSSAEAADLAQRAGAATGERHVNIEVITVPDDQAALNAVRHGQAEAYLHQDGQGWVLTGKEAPGTVLTAQLAGVVQQHALERNAAAANTTVEQLQQGSMLRSAALESDVDQAGSLVRLLAGIVFAMLFYIAALLFGMAIAQSVVEEKQSRVVEILATAIPVRQLLIGKVVGNTLLALGQMVLFVGAALIGITFTDYKSYVPSLSGPILWYLAFFVAGFVTLACVWAVAGSLASRVEDLQSTTMPVTMVLVVALFGGLAAQGVAQVVVSYVPLLSTITMPLRLLAGEAAWWEPVLSLLITLVATALIISVAEKVYRRSLLQSKGRMTFRQALATAD